MKVKEIKVTFDVVGTHTQTILVEDGIDLQQLRQELESDTCHTSTTGKMLVRSGEDHGLQTIGEITIQSPNIKYQNFKISEI